MAKRKRSDHELAEELANRISKTPNAGAAARDLIQRAYDVGESPLRSHYMARAQRAIAQLDPARQGPLIRELQGHMLALQGRGGDSAIAHVTPGEFVIPRSMQTPELWRLIATEARKHGIDPASLVVNSSRNAINPDTGHMEFDEDELEDRAPASDATPPAPEPAPPSPPAPITPSNNLRDVADQIADHINNQPAAAASNPNTCQLVPPSGQFNAAKGVVPLFQPQMASKLGTAIQNLNDQGIVPTMTSGYRPQATQAALQAADQAGKSNYPVAKISPHQVGLGVDFGLHSNPQHNDAIHDALTAVGLQNGSSFSRPDPIHYFTSDARQSQTPAMVKACADAYANLNNEDEE